MRPGSCIKKEALGEVHNIEGLAVQAMKCVFEKMRMHELGFQTIHEKIEALRGQSVVCIAVDVSNWAHWICELKACAIQVSVSCRSA